MISTQRSMRENQHTPETHNTACPVCGGPMKRVHNTFDNRNPEFDWYECSQRNCPGWRVRTPAFRPQFAT